MRNSFKNVREKKKEKEIGKLKKKKRDMNERREKIQYTQGSARHWKYEGEQSSNNLYTHTCMRVCVCVDISKNNISKKHYFASLMSHRQRRPNYIGIEFSNLFRRRSGLDGKVLLRIESVL